MYRKFDIRDYSKPIEKYQKGDVIESEIEEMEIPIKFSQMSDERDKVKAFYNDMLNSQWYKNRLKKNGYGNGF